MISKVINLNWKEYNLSTLLNEDGQLKYIVNKEQLIGASYENCPVELVIIDKKYIDKLENIDSIPSIFSDFYISKNRKSLRKLLDIKPDDSYFDSLYKVASQSDLLLKDGFWISNDNLSLDDIQETEYTLKL